MPSSQQCSRCDEAKPFDAFHPGKRGRNGYWCKQCCNQRKRERVAIAAKYKPVRAPRPLRTPRQLSTGYRAVHQRIQRMRGKASLQLCACGRQAVEWAYQHTDINPLHGHTPRGLATTYSADPLRYEAMCHSCHVKLDRRRIA